MLTRTFFAPILLLLGSLTARVSAESELTHAYERIFICGAYWFEGPLDSKVRSVATGCTGLNGRRCTFNECVHYLATGTWKDAPVIISSDELDFSNKKAIDTAARRISENPSSEPRNRLEAKLVFGKDGFNSMVLRVSEVILRTLSVADEPNAREMFKKRATQIRVGVPYLAQTIKTLRHGAQQVKLSEELTKAFPKESVYPIYEGKYTPITWKFKENNVGNKFWQEIDFEATAINNKDLQYITTNNVREKSPLRLKVDERIDMFNIDYEGTITYDRNHVRANRNHAALAGVYDDLSEKVTKGCKKS